MPEKTVSRDCANARKAALRVNTKHEQVIGESPKLGNKFAPGDPNVICGYINND